MREVLPAIVFLGNFRNIDVIFTLYNYFGICKRFDYWSLAFSYLTYI